MATKAKRKKCFIIGPIGAEGSQERTEADWLLRGIVEPVLKNDPFNFVVQRADQISEPGLITDQVIAAVIEADLAVADLTGANPNAFYELAIRHMEQKAVIHMVKKGEQLPFDIKDYRAVFYSREHPDDLEEAKVALAKQAKAALGAGYEPRNPITKARGMVELERSADSKDKILANIVEGQQRLESRLRTLESLSATLYGAGLTKPSTLGLRPTDYPDFLKISHDIEMGAHLLDTDSNVLKLLNKNKDDFASLLTENRQDKTVGPPPKSQDKKDES